MRRKLSVVYTDNAILLSVKKKGILTQAITQVMNLGDTTLSEISQAQKDAFFMIPLQCGSRIYRDRK